MSKLSDRARFERDHRWAPEHMSGYLDGDLAARARARMEHHLAECGHCRRLLAGLRAVVGGLHRLPAPDGLDAVQIAALVRWRLNEPPPD
ncbi:MAG: zf-HC2 domain-containing protein [Solirubrobacteraceae bacterium]